PLPSPLFPYTTLFRSSESEITSLVAYVASLGPGPPVPKPHPERGSLSEGQHLFTEHCAGCHQVVAEGGYVTGAVPPALDAATPRSEEHTSELQSLAYL